MPPRYPRPTLPLYGTKAWKTVRAKVRARDGNRCVNCGSTERLEVDHIVRPEDGGAPLDEQNLRTLCGRCHRRRTAAAVVARRRRNKTKRTQRHVRYEW